MTVTQERAHFLKCKGSYKMFLLSRALVVFEDMECTLLTVFLRTLDYSIL